MEFALMASIIFASLSVSRMGKLNGPLAIQIMKDSVMEENYKGWFELVTSPTFKIRNGDRCELLGNPHQEPPVCKIGRFEVIKYSFGPAEKYIAIKECEHDDWQRTEEDAC
ncbi:hypothetical protein Tco_0478705 [Tanacetum coccineum]